MAAVSLALFVPMLHADPVWVGGFIQGSIQNAGCQSPCPGWDTIYQGQLQYGNPSQVSRVLFNPNGGFAVNLNGPAMGIGQLQLQNANLWSGDDPTATYTATLSVDVHMTQQASQTTTLTWGLTLNASKNGTDVLQLPATTSVPFQEGSQTYYLNVGGFQPSTLSAGEWGYTTAYMTASMTTAPTGTVWGAGSPSTPGGGSHGLGGGGGIVLDSPAPEPASGLLLLSGFVLLAIALPRAAKLNRASRAPHE